MLHLTMSWNVLIDSVIAGHNVSRVATWLCTLFALSPPVKPLTPQRLAPFTGRRRADTLGAPP